MRCSGAGASAGPTTPCPGTTRRHGESLSSAHSASKRPQRSAAISRWWPEMGMEHVRKVYWLRDAELKGLKKAVLVSIAFHAGHESLKCRLKYETIAGEIGAGLRTVEKYVPELEKDGYIARGKRTRRQNGTHGTFEWLTLLPPAISATGPPAESANNHREICGAVTHYMNQLLLPQ